MTNALGTSATFGPNKTVENIGEGNVSVFFPKASSVRDSHQESA